MSAGSSRGAEWRATRLYVLERDGWTCGYCGNEADQVDHIVAKANGGTDDPYNLTACCADCNRKKGTKILTRYSGRNERWYAA